MGRKRRNTFSESAVQNNSTYAQYRDRLTELSLSMFEWKNLPDTIDARFLEMTLFTDGYAVFFKDEVMGYLALQLAANGPFNVYRVPIHRRAYAVNGYQNAELNENNSVIIYNNMLRTNSIRDVLIYSRRLWDLDRTIDINARAQKTPVLIKGSETQMLTLKNVYMQFDGNSPVLYGDKNLDLSGITVLQTGAPYVADKLYELKTQIWNEALTALGISNVNIVKKERLITDEVQRNQGGTVASRYSRLESRRQACRMINNMFGLNIWCDYREDYQLPDDSSNEEGSENG